MRDLVLEVLVETTRASSSRKSIFLEKILGTFDAQLYPSIDDGLDGVGFIQACVDASA